jgi:hypothetical protein
MFIVPECHIQGSRTNSNTWFGMGRLDSYSVITEKSLDRLLSEPTTIYIHDLWKITLDYSCEIPPHTIEKVSDH